MSIETKIMCDDQKPCCTMAICQKKDTETDVRRVIKEKVEVNRKEIVRFELSYL
jgi:hypothetical protein